MSKPVLYLMLGYPGAGKTTTAKVIHQVTGAVHLWADHIRRERFGHPTFSHKENLQLYDHLNELTAELLAAGNSVVFDTAFNLREDREKLRKIAAKHHAAAKLIWVQTPHDLARERAFKDVHLQETRVIGHLMTTADFERLSNKLEPPHTDEPYIAVDGTKVTPDYIKQILQ